jgi:hypothetical protein
VNDFWHRRYYSVTKIGLLAVSLGLLGEVRGGEVSCIHGKPVQMLLSLGRNTEFMSAVSVS